MPKAYIIARSAISYRRYITRSARNGYHCKKPLLSGRQKRFFTWSRGRESICIFAYGENKCSPPSSRRRQRSSTLHLDVFDSLLFTNKECHSGRGGILWWSRVRESNPPSRLGKPLYYRYTNPAQCVGIIAEGKAKSNPFLSNNDNGKLRTIFKIGLYKPQFFCYNPNRSTIIWPCGAVG